jgi:hypothetical protein
VSALTVWQGIRYLHGQAALPDVAVVLCLSAWSLAARTWGELQNRRRELSPANFRYVVLGCVMAAHLAFAAAVGGDWMEFGRFLVAPLPLAIVLSVDVAYRGRSRAAAFSAFAALGAANLLISAIAASSDGNSAGAPFWRRRVVEGPTEVSWFDSTNRVRADDLGMIPTTTRVVQAAIEKNRRRIVVFSGQAGTMVYYLGKRFYQSIVFVDLRGLVTREVTRCPAAGELPRNIYGIALRYEEFFQRRDAFASCDIPEPDVIFDLLPPSTVRFLTARGYDPVQVSDGSGVRPPQWLLVRRGLLEGRRAGSVAQTGDERPRTVTVPGAAAPIDAGRPFSFPITDVRRHSLNEGDSP